MNKKMDRIKKIFCVTNVIWMCLALLYFIGLVFWNERGGVYRLLDAMGLDVIYYDEAIMGPCFLFLPTCLVLGIVTLIFYRKQLPWYGIAAGLLTPAAAWLILFLGDFMFDLYYYALIGKVIYHILVVFLAGMLAFLAVLQIIGLIKYVRRREHI